MNTKTRIWDAVEHLETDEDIAAYLDAAMEDGDLPLITAVLGDIARAKGITEIVRQTGLDRDSLYKALSAEGKPEFDTILKIVHALGLRLSVSPILRKSEA
ncbi:MAG: putative addiction module antidote protein [Deltaproteobacteria bacterium]|nr:putative addiction module antidote protein [Deltaproteobacteria bacterium]